MEELLKILKEKTGNDEDDDVSLKDLLTSLKKELEKGDDGDEKKSEEADESLEDMLERLDKLSDEEKESFKEDAIAPLQDRLNAIRNQLAQTQVPKTNLAPGDKQDEGGGMDAMMMIILVFLLLKMMMGGG